MTLPEVHSILWSLVRHEPGNAVAAPDRDDPIWHGLVQQSLAQGLLPLLHQWSLTPEGKRRIPSKLRAQLDSEAARMTATNLVLAEELRAILTQCRDRGLSCVPLRGLAVAEQLHGPGTLRPTGDIDLLVRRSDLPAMTELLTSLGYAGMEHRPGFAGTFSYTLEFVKDRHGWIVVEPHWTLAYPPFTESLDMEQVWSRCRKGRIAGITTWLLRDEDLLVHLCWHILHQGNQAPLLWWIELDLLIRRTQASLRWDLIVATAGQSGQSFLVSEVLQALRDRFQSPIPHSTLTCLAAQRSPARLATLLVQDPGLNGREEFAQFLSLPGVPAKLRYAFGLLCPAPDYMILRYGARGRAKLGLAYVTRLLNLSWEGLRWTGALLVAAFSARATFPR